MSLYAALPKAAALAIPITLGAWTVQAADIIETAGETGRFNGFLRLVEATGMTEMLEGEGPFTIFAPIDEAFGQLPVGVIEWLLAEEGRKALEVVIQSHIVGNAAIVTGDLLGRTVEAPTIGGGTLAIDGTRGFILLAPIGANITEVDGQEVGEQKGRAIPISATVVQAPQARFFGAERSATSAQQALMDVAVVVKPDIEADNGVIHGIDLVLLPPEALWLF